MQFEKYLKVNAESFIVLNLKKSLLLQSEISSNYYLEKIWSNLPKADATDYID